MGVPLPFWSLFARTGDRKARTCGWALVLFLSSKVTIETVGSAYALSLLVHYCAEQGGTYEAGIANIISGR